MKESVGFGYVIEMAEIFKEYENHRDEYRTFKDFFPEIIKGLKDIERKVIADQK